MAAEGYKDIAHLAGLVFIKRGFAADAAADSGVIDAACPFGDLTAEQRTVFVEALQHSELQKVISQWWEKYDAARAAGELSEVRAWEP